MKPDLRITDPDDFEKVVARQCMTLGYEVVMPTKNNPGYDIEELEKFFFDYVIRRNHHQDRIGGSRRSPVP